MRKLNSANDVYASLVKDADTPDQPANSGNTTDDISERTLSLGRWIDRLSFESNFIKAFERHACYTLAYLLMLFFICSTIDNSDVVLADRVTGSMFQFSSISDVKSHDEFVGWINGTISAKGMNNSDIVRVPSLLEFRKFKMMECSEAPPLVGPTTILLSRSSCFSKSDRVSVEKSCVQTNDTLSCLSLCIDSTTEPVPSECVGEIQGEVAYSNEALVIIGLRNGLNISSEFPIASIHVSMALYSTQYEVLTVVKVHFRKSPTANVSVNIYRDSYHIPEKPFVVWAIVAIVACSISLFLDLRFAWGGKLAKSLAYLGSAGLISLVGLRLYFFQSVLDLQKRISALTASNQSMETTLTRYASLDDLKLWRGLVDLVTVISMLGGSLRLLEAYPGSNALSWIVSRGKSDWILIGVVIGVAFVYFSVVGGVVMETSPRQVLRELVQVPFGVWPFHDGNGLVLFVFGMIVFYYLLTFVQMRVAHFHGRYLVEAQNVASQGLIADIVTCMHIYWKTKSLSGWPTEYLTALQNILLSREGDIEDFNQRVSFDEFQKALPRVDVSPFWEFYASRFARDSRGFLHAGFVPIRATQRQVQNALNRVHSVFERAEVCRETVRWNSAMVAEKLARLKSDVVETNSRLHEAVAQSQTSSAQLLETEKEIAQLQSAIRDILSTF